MKDVPAQLGELGPCLIGTSYQNNSFTIGYGGRMEPNRPDYLNNMNYLIDATFENGSWRFGGYKPDPTKILCRVTCDVPERSQELAVQAILGNDELRAKLEKWRRDAVKRLRKSVPRLKAEYEAAARRLEALDSIQF